MPASAIAQILLRISALSFFLTGLTRSVFVVEMLTEYGEFRFYWLIPPAIFLIASIIVWLIAPKLSRLAAGSNDGEFKLEGVTETQLFATTILGLGLYFALTSFAGVFNWIHFFTVHKSPDYGFHQEEAPSYYELTEAVLTFAAGMTLVFTAKRWAKKLADGFSAKEAGDAGGDG